MDDLTGNAGDADLQQTGVEDTGVADQTTGSPDAGEGLKAAAAAERKKRQEIEAQLQATREEQEALREQIAILRAGSQPQTPNVPLGTYDENDFVQVGPLRQELQKYGQQVMGTMLLQQFAQTHPDHAELVGSFDASGRFRPAETLKQAMKDNPGLRGLDIALSQNPTAVLPFAYEAARLARENMEIKNKHAATEQHLTQRELADKTAPLSASAAGGAAAIPTEAAIAGSDDVFADTYKRVMAGEFG